VNSTATDSLNRATDKQRSDVLGDGAEDGADGESDEGEYQTDGATEHIANRAYDGHRYCIDKEV
jgi:hypothetical protein